MPLRILVEYDPVNSSNYVSSGDILCGRIRLEVEKETKIDRLRIKLQGEAIVSWHERSGRSTFRYSDKEEYFSFDKIIINDDCEVVGPGTHVYPFTFQIPYENHPASFNGVHGSISYYLKAKLERSMRPSSKVVLQINYHPRREMTTSRLMEPQNETMTKHMKMFNSGYVYFTVDTERTGYHLGEEIKAVVDVQNRSNRAVKPSFCFYTKQSFFAQSKSNVWKCIVYQEEMEALDKSERQILTKCIPLPRGLDLSILRCKLINVEYILKVYLKIPFCSNPEIKIPIVVLPPKPDPALQDAPEEPAPDPQEAAEMAPSSGLEGNWTSDLSGPTTCI